MTSQDLPNEESVSELLTSLMGDEVLVKQCSQSLNSDAAHVIATYVDADGVADKVIACDMAFANRIGAALTRIPPGSANDSIKSETVPDNIFENLQEVLNICTNIFPQATVHHVTLGEVTKPEDKSALPDPETTESIVFEIDVPRYGTGVVAIYDVAVEAAAS